MTLSAEKVYEHIGETQGIADHDHDMVHELSKKLDALWRYDQYIANANGNAKAQSLWRDFKKQCQADIKQLKQLIAEEINKGCF